MIELTKYENAIAGIETYEALIHIGDMGFLLASGTTKEKAIDNLKKEVDVFLKPLLNIDYNNITDMT